MMTIKIKIIFFSLVLFSVQSLFGAIGIKSIDSFTKATYDSATGFERIFEIDINKTSGPAVSYFLTISSGSSGNSLMRTAIDPVTSSSIVYYLYDDAANMNIIRDISDIPSGAEVIFGAFPVSSGGPLIQIVSCTAVIPSGSFLPSGDFSDSVTFDLYEGDLSSYVFVESKSVDFSFEVLPVIELALVNSGEPFDPARTTLDFAFGVLAMDQTMSGDILVRSTTPYTVEILSDNQGAMARTDIVDPLVVPYFCYVDTVLLDLSRKNIAVLAASGLATTTDGNRHTIEIVIGNFFAVTAGTFGDVITITVAAQ